MHGLAGAEAQRRHHQADAQVVGGAHRCALDAAQRSPRAPFGVISAIRHHRRARRGEADGHFPRIQSGTKLDIKPIR